MKLDILGTMQKAKVIAPKSFGPTPGIVLTNTELEKFAELVILECIRVVEAERDPPTLNYKPSVKISESIKRNFGL